MPRLARVLGSMALAALVLLPAPLARARRIPALSALPSGAPYEFVFDDFLYARPADYSTAAGALRGGSPGTLFGPNPWFQGCPSCALV